MSGLGSFRRRVRFLRAWKGLAAGGCAGALAAFAWAALDFFRVYYATWIGLLLLVLIGAVIGGLVGFLRRLPDHDLAVSIDQRAKLKDRLGTSVRNLQSSSFAEAQRVDAEANLANVRPAAIYPVRLSRWHGGLLAIGVAASVVFLLGNSPLLLTSQQQKDKAELQRLAPAVEQVAKPLLDSPDKTAEEQQLAKRLEQYRDELKRGRIPKEQAMQEANDLSKQAQDLAAKQNQQSQQSMSSAESALDKMKNDALEKDGLTKEEASQFKSAQDAASKASALQQQVGELQKELDSGKDANGQPLTKQQVEALNKQLKELEHQLELSKKATDFLNRLESLPEYKELLKLLGQCNGSAAGQLTDEQLKQLIQMMNALADKYKTDAEKRQFLRDLMNALKDGQGSKQMMLMAQAILGMLVTGSYGHPGPGNGTELFYANLHKIPLSAKSSDIKAKAIPLGVTGDRQQGGTETYVELKGPSGLGEKSKVPYEKVLPKYRREAEQAMERDQIPPEDQKRVKDYFDSLENGG